MKRNIIGRQINEFAKATNDLPTYFGDHFWQDKYSSNDKWVKINGEFIANRYNSILQIIEETKAKVTIHQDCIFINYTNGEIKICRDLLTDTFLIPKLTA